MTLEAIKYNDGKLEILDQILLPLETKYVRVDGVNEGWNVIKRMQTRGAPAIGITAGLSLATELNGRDFESVPQLQKFVEEKMAYLVTARPTAVNIVDTQRKVQSLCAEAVSEGVSPAEMKQRIVQYLESMLDEDIKVNKTMGAYGADHILSKYNNQPVKLLTHCNAGALATGGYGTAVGVIRAVNERQKLEGCYCTETRPYNQGARLTAYEYVHDKLPGTLICDSMAAMLMKTKGISAIVVGADRVVANGDAANKIGTYQLAITAKYHDVPFYFVAPSTSIDLTMKTGDEILIEERAEEEMTHVNNQRIAAPGISVWNPAFDVTPAALITGGIVTEFGVFKPEDLEKSLTLELKKSSK